MDPADARDIQRLPEGRDPSARQRRKARHWEEHGQEADLHAALLRVHHGPARLRPRAHQGRLPSRGAARGGRAQARAGQWAR